MDPNAFDSVAGVGLLLLMPVSVLFVAAALRRLAVPRWSWALYLLGVAGVLVLLHFAGHTRYEVDDDRQIWWDFGQFVGLGLGRIGVGVNAVVATAWILSRPRGADEVLPRRETRLVAASYLTTAIATALPATWWAAGLGIVPLPIELAVVTVGVGFLSGALWLRRTRATRADEAVQVPEFLWPLDAGIAIALVGLLAVGPLLTGSGLPDGSLGRVPETATTTEPSVTPDPDWPGPVPTTTTTLDADAIEADTRSLLEDTIRWAGPLDDLSSPTPAAARPPQVELVAERCDDGGRRWTGSLVLPTVRPQDLAPRVQAGWDAAGYAAVDRAMGTDLVMPLRGDAAVERMRLGGGPDGVHVDVESFCTGT